jgi:hypothetical protein
MSDMPSLKPNAKLDARAAASAADDEVFDTLQQKLQALLDELQGIQMFLSSSDGLLARKEDVIQKDNDLTKRIKVSTALILHHVFP